MVFEEGQEIEDIEFETLKDSEQYRWLECGKGTFFHFKVNPVIFFIATVVIWGFVIYCALYPLESNAMFLKWQAWVTTWLTWMYIGTQQVWVFFLVYIFFSRQADMKLGEGKPDYSDISWFSMLFSSGVAVGLTFYGVAEPVWHYTGGFYHNRYQSGDDNERSLDAVTITAFHWGFHAYCVYCLDGLLLALVAYKLGLPMNERSCLYPILGQRVYGLLGELIDTLSIIATLFGVCTSLGLGVMQLNTGLNIASGGAIAEDKWTMLQVIIGVTLLATLSVLSGLKNGIRRISEFTFLLGNVMLLTVFFMDDWKYCLNIFVESTFQYMQYFIDLGGRTDGFAQSIPQVPNVWVQDVGATTQSRQQVAPSGTSEWASPNQWGFMGAWTIFYWGWWISWAPFVGTFIAKISRGRTVREFIIGTILAPVLYLLFWFSVFGALGIKNMRFSALSGLTDLTTCGTDQPMNQVKWSDMAAAVMTNQGQDLETSFHPIMTEQVVKVDCWGGTGMWFGQLYSQGSDFFYPAAWATLVMLVFYFVTSSDSGSHVVDCHASNGALECPPLQKIYWSVTEGSTAIVLLWSGGGENQTALRALQAVSIVAGVPITVFICFYCVSLYKYCDAIQSKDIDPNFPPELKELEFEALMGVKDNVSIFDIFTSCSATHWTGFGISLVCPVFPLYTAYIKKSNNQGPMMVMFVITALCFQSFIVTLIMWLVTRSQAGFPPMFQIFQGIFSGIVKSASYEEISGSLSWQDQQKEGSIAYDMISYITLQPLAGARDYALSSKEETVY